MKRIALSLVVALGLVIGLSACDESADVQTAIEQSFPGSLTAKATRVADCESGLNPKAVSPGGANHGLFQINSVHKATVQQMGYSWDQIYDPYVNSQVAKRLYDEAARRGNGWSPWGCRNA